MARGKASDNNSQRKGGIMPGNISFTKHPVTKQERTTKQRRD
jgi:hypothetical protein